MVSRKRSSILALSVLRQIKGTLGRYLAIFAIIALGVGFFAGLRVSTDAMLRTADDYLKEKKLYDFRLISTLGLTGEDAAAFAGLEGVETALGSVCADFLCKSGEGNVVFRAHLLTEEMNRADLVAGRMPQAGNECLLDGAGQRSILCQLRAGNHRSGPGQAGGLCLPARRGLRPGPVYRGIPDPGGGGRPLFRRV